MSAVVLFSLLQGCNRGKESTDSGHDTSDPRELGRAACEFGDESANETANDRRDDDVDRNEPPGKEWEQFRVACILMCEMTFPAKSCIHPDNFKTWHTLHIFHGNLSREASDQSAAMMGRGVDTLP